ncbi:protein phosphatase CheZ [Thiomicrospira microaerophila]|uniref:protein phosphatase CheZ n=1 Tax=Thiomicrospira microaerophila TaxID=406020 RepID=UPI00200DDF9B|nr:protein phosphatase CheZ [Thiomicrospira microaerophila]UQB41670.1 protein phosphatase CheZ [Thiomicrospira microaerophila]
MSISKELNQQDLVDLLQALQLGDDQQVDFLFKKITAVKEDALYQSLGQMTRNLHESLKQVDDIELMHQVKHDLPDLNERIQYVLSSTEQAVDTTLTAAESIGQTLDQLDILRTELTEGQANKLDEALTLISQQCNEIMQAQSFQDLTGQVLKRMLVVMGAFEHSLLDLIQRSGQSLENLPPRNHDQQKEDMKGVGPAATKQEKNKGAHSQDEVDDLLADLGF